MVNFLVRRTSIALLTLIVLSMIAFVIIQLPPGDYVDHYVIQLLQGGRADRASAVSEALEKNLRREMGLDRPQLVQYGKWIWKIVRGDFGMSLEFQKPVSEVIGERLLMTIILAGTTALFAWALSIPIGIYSAVRQHSIEDYTITFIGFLGLAVPDFLLALWLLLGLGEA